ncbi:hypothetical protein OHA77_33565 [Streptosporangium sp. NBC_01639]|uniref:hypothetical protein n=1 Tax=unclassified Streptosporangium TaxID=2632669 RepID=UPI002DDA8FC8|nr:hypothetical protein [Streptosporangium sp. NBC_01756]WSC87798.1 hypothetical protein OIE48_06170 [Streptosporangium sp. NBC_01756]WTD53519.1 hypothetical protein OHA77_33565 [Streptosporangium sp. NBC_01639]
MQSFERNDYETEARKALQKGDVAAAQVWATLRVAENLENHLAEIGSRLSEIETRLQGI